MRTLVAITLVVTQCFADECPEDETVLLQTKFKQSSVETHSEASQEKAEALQGKAARQPDQPPEPFHGICGLDLFPGVEHDTTMEEVEAIFEGACAEAYSDTVCSALGHELFSTEAFNFGEGADSFMEQLPHHPEFCLSLFELIQVSQHHLDEIPVPASLLERAQMQRHRGKDNVEKSLAGKGGGSGHGGHGGHGYHGGHGGYSVAYTTAAPVPIHTPGPSPAPTPPVAVGIGGWDNDYSNYDWSSYTFDWSGAWALW